MDGRKTRMPHLQKQSTLPLRLMHYSSIAVEVMLGWVMLGWFEWVD
jgi:hypothetical protein